MRGKSMNSIKMEELTYVDIKRLIDEGYKTVVFGVGSTEQHGPSLPECTDALQAERFAHIIAKELGNTLQARTITVGYSEYHLPFAGTISLRESTLKSIIEDYINSLVRHRFKRIIIYNSHGGNSKAIKEVMEEMKKKYPNIKMVYYYDQNIAPALKQVVQKYGLTVGEIGSHAGDMEASIMCYLEPDLVRKERFVKGLVKVLTPRWKKKFHREGFDAITENGVVGDQRKASAEKGEFYLNVFKSIVLDYIRKQLNT